MGAIVLAAVAYSSSTSFPGPAALLPTVGATAFIAAGINKTSAAYAPSRLLSLWPFRFVGDRSYAFYLWHWPVLILAMEHTGHDLSTVTNLLLLAAAFALSTVTYALFENPVRRTPRLNAAGGLALWPAAVLSVLVVASYKWEAYQDAINLAAPVAKAMVAPLPVVQIAPEPTFANTPTVNTASPSAVVAAAKAADAARPIPSPLTPSALSLASSGYSLPTSCVAHSGQTSSSICSFASTASPKTLVVFGDSHAQTWMPPIISFGQRQGYDVRPLVKIGCNPFRWSGAAQTGQCTAWYKWAVGQVRALHPAVLLLVTHYDVSPIESDISISGPESVANMSTFLAAVKKSVHQTVVLGDPPGQTSEPTDCLLASHPNMRTCSRAPSPAQLQTTGDVASATQGFGKFIDATPWLCSDGVCPMVIGHTIAYADHDHLTAAYTGELTAVLEAALRQALSTARGSPRHT